MTACESRFAIFRSRPCRSVPCGLCHFPDCSMVGVKNNRSAFPVSRRSAGTKPRSGVQYSPGRAVLGEPWDRGFSTIKPRRGVLMCHTRWRSYYGKTPLRGLGVIGHPFPGLAEYRSPWAIVDAAPRLIPATSPRGRGGIVFRAGRSAMQKGKAETNVPPHTTFHNAKRQSHCDA